MKARIITKHSDRHSPEATARVVDTLRAEAVSGCEALAARNAELESERASFAESRAVLNEALDRHRQALAEHDENAQRLYAEIERLTSLVEEMEGTKAWRLHRSLEKLRGR